MYQRFLLFLIIGCFFELSAQGAKLLSEDQLDDFGQYNSEEFGFSGVLPKSFSLEKWVPPVADQGDTSTCVGFAAAYYSLSTIYNMEFNYYSSKDKLAHAFDPHFIYSLINNYVDYDCDEGLYMDDAVEKLQYIGAKKRWFYPYTRCNTDWSTEMQKRVRNYTLPYKIKNYGFINPYQIDKFKEGIVLGLPITAMFRLTESFNSVKAKSIELNFISENGLWSPNENENFLGYHAMTIVGYNDYIFGGAFRIVNSWGDDFADNGFVWITYSDFQKFCEQAFVFSVDFTENIKNRENYERYKVDTGIYEGEYFSDGLNGYGVWYSNDEDNYHFGFLNEGNWSDGPYIKITNSDFLYGRIQDGLFIDESTFGFVGDDEDEKIIKEYFNQFNSSLNVRKLVRSDEVNIKRERPKKSNRILTKMKRPR